MEILRPRWGNGDVDRYRVTETNVKETYGTSSCSTFSPGDQFGTRASARKVGGFQYAKGRYGIDRSTFNRENASLAQASSIASDAKLRFA